MQCICIHCQVHWKPKPCKAYMETTPCKSILTGKNLFSLQGTLFLLQESCFHYRDFPVNPCTSLYGIAVWSTYLTYINTAFPVVPKHVEIIQTHPNLDLLLEGPGLIGLMSIYFICGRRRLTLPSTICFSACMQLVHSESLVCSENLWMPFHLKGKVDPCQV